MNDIKQKTLLLMEDEVIIARLESQQFKDEGYKVIIAMNGEGTIDMIYTKDEIYEEMLRTNKKLQIVNDELQTKLDDYTSINNDLKNTEHQYRLLFENMTNIFMLHEIIYDNQGNPVDYRYLAANPAFEKSTGIPVSSIIGRTAREIFPETKQSWIDIFGKVVRTGEPVSCEVRWTELNKDFDTWIFQTENNNFAGIFSDITDRKLADETVQNLLYEKEIVLKEGHHRVKNNMNTIYGLLSLQADHQLNSDTKNILLDSAGRVRSMMILYDKLFRSDMQSALSIKDYLPLLINEIVSIFPKKNPVKIETRIEDIILPSSILSLLGIMINELITNSMKYAFTDIDYGIITVSASKNKNHILLIYEDNGAGIPESITFEKSTGFGMQLVGMLIGQINGVITVQREHGTKLIIEFDV